MVEQCSTILRGRTRAVPTCFAVSGWCAHGRGPRAREEAPEGAVVATDPASTDADRDNGIVLQGELGCYGRDGDATHRVDAPRWTPQAVYLPGARQLPRPRSIAPLSPFLLCHHLPGYGEFGGVATGTRGRCGDVLSQPDRLLRREGEGDVARPVGRDGLAAQQ